MADHDALSLSTIRTPNARSTRTRATLPCLTLVAHPDSARLGERAVLKALLVGQRLAVSRSEPAFGKPGGPATAPLADQHVSRTPFFLSSSASGGVTIEAGEGEPPRVFGERVAGTRECSRAELERGVLIELGARVALVLGSSSNRPLTELPGILGQSDAIDDVRREILNVADLDTAVLILGETGCGKELVAQAIHAASPRSAHEFVAVNMAAIPETTAASVLFGHVRGAFSGALQRHHGVFERASAGTLLLDELGETPLGVQPMLLRAIETRRILPLGDEHERSVDVRLLAATDADLHRELQEDSFNAALLHRLAGYELHVPPLRERGEDIALLLWTFVQQELEQVGEQHKRSDFEALLVRSGFLARLMQHELPGNIRQLRNLARHLVIANRRSEAPAITPAIERLLGAPPAASRAAHESDAAPVLTPAPRTRPPSERPGAPGQAISEAQLLDALRGHGFSPNRAAASLGIPTGTLHDLMRKSKLVRRAADLDEAELREAHQACAGDLQAMADRLQVSERGLRITLKQRRMLDED
jgi:two-component system, NtrC family, nitrogen regulation response regulator GlnG